MTNAKKFGRHGFLIEAKPKCAYLEKHIIEASKKIGGGNFSAGLKIAVEHFLKTNGGKND